ncbi:DUF262 domain-containing HNH endonuclease family protein [Clostridium estertheticum]|uniref:DUF262 domain-containing protein n=1 Tax=Clostridium estertheticum TaxID=238834 RepID=UPI001C6EEE55|nr:DUF262 domain-containing protein [Clostridium estertheticum]MBW9173430.1 DUF262 domain-containing HNH endonuclease family protein [Clostridium estertheticum]WLC76568.1 DUF262 domain-containing HNH endonuclease family protein [Clostridium estertheticum]
MIAIQTSMLLFMQQPKQQFIIPVYQRTYKWTRFNCRQLLEDIKRVSAFKNKTHFVGSIVYITDEYFQATKINQLSIIDGQQRITTISLLLLAMCRYLKENPEKFETTAEELFNEYLTNNTYKNKYENNYIKLDLTKHDRDIYFKLIKDDVVEDVTHNIYTNYKYFYETIKKDSIDIDKLYDGIAKLMIVDVSLVRTQDDPQLIFESLNSTGVKLTQADLIRNYLLMDLEIEFQSRIYNDFWFQIENKLRDDKEELSEFIRDYLTIKNEKIPNKLEVYVEFKKYFRNNFSRCETDIEKLIKELYTYSNIYEKIIKSQEKKSKINRYLIDFDELDLKVINPLLLKIYYDYEMKIINEEQLIYVFNLLESSIVRRIICGAPTNSLSKIFLTLIKNIDKMNYVKSIEEILMSREGNQRFPREDEFENNFILKDVYNLKPSNRRFILEKLENSESKEILNIEEFTIEHIMPQSTSLSDKWVNALGDDWKEIHSKYLHTIGNLSLTRYNSEMSNKFFTDKRDIKGGFRDSACWLNKDLRNLDTWNETEIIKRAKNLFTIASNIWKMPTIKDLKNAYNVILDFEDDWSYKKPKYFTFMDEKHEIKDITQLYVDIIGLFYCYDPEFFLNIINDELIISKKMFSVDENAFFKSRQLADTTFFINTNFSSDAKKNNLLALTNEIGFSEDDFVIYL